MDDALQRIEALQEKADTDFAKGQADALSDLQNEAVDQSAFPFGHWPKAVNV